jgi:high-affinity iron transporter
MMESFLIASRETLEASLVVGIVLSYLNKTGQERYNKSVYAGIIAGIIVTVLSAFLFMAIAGGFEGESEEVFESITMMVAAFLLTTMILWMMKQKHVAKHIENKVETHIKNAQISEWGKWGLFLLIFTAILREGVETVIFLSAISYTSGISLMGGLMGIIVAMGIGYLFFISAKRVHLKQFFNASSVLLILFAAGLILDGVHDLVEEGEVSGIAPILNLGIEQKIDGSYPIMHEEGAVGSFLKGLFGYHTQISLTEILAYGAYLAIIYVFYRKIEQSKLTA